MSDDSVLQHMNNDVQKKVWRVQLCMQPKDGQLQRWADACKHNPWTHFLGFFGFRYHL
jgi:hypothetical protein